MTPRDTSGQKKVVVVGTNQRSGLAALRDSLFVEDGAVPSFLAEMAGQGLGECLVMSTCDRVEIHAAHEDPGFAARLAEGVFARRAKLSRQELHAQLYTHMGIPAVRHIFAVAASLDSMVVGEPQVLGQVRASHAAAVQAGTIGPALENVLQAAYGAAKRVRSETAIARGPVSMAASAVQVARDVHGDLDRVRCLLIGAGEMGELMVEQLQLAGLGDLTVAAATPARAAAAARRHGCDSVTFDDLAHALPQADIVVAAVGSGRHLVGSAQVAAALTERRRRPMFFIDAAVPGDIDPAVGGVDDAFVYDLDDLESVAQEARTGREEAAQTAWRIIDEALDTFQRRQNERGAVPALVRLRDHFESARADILSTADPADAADATRRLVNRLLHDPYTVLRRTAATREDEKLTAAALRLFRLDDKNDGGSGEP